jgi:hypothetical protein
MNTKILLSESLKAFNEMPNTKLSGPKFTNTYAIAAAISKYQKESEEGSFVLCYTLRTVARDTYSGTITDTDHFEVFCEENVQGLSQKAQAKKRLWQLCDRYDTDETDTELYTWNIAKITKTNEHYTIVH